MWIFCQYRLALYVYEYLLHIGAQKSAQTFLSEVWGIWSKNESLTTLKQTNKQNKHFLVYVNAFIALKSVLLESVELNCVCCFFF